MSVSVYVCGAGDPLSISVRIPFLSGEGRVYYVSIIFCGRRSCGCGVSVAVRSSAVCEMRTIVYKGIPIDYLAAVAVVNH